MIRCTKFFFIILLSMLNISTYAQDSKISNLKTRIKQSPNSTGKVDLMHDLFNLYFANDVYKKEAEKIELKALSASSKLSYKKGEYIAYKNLYNYYKKYSNTSKKIKYQILYTQNKKKLEQILENEKKKKEELDRRRYLEKIRREKKKREDEIKELQKDKGANKALIEDKLKELEKANVLLDESQSAIEESQIKISSIEDSIQKQALLNEKLSLENKILEEEKRYSTLSEKAARSKNNFYMILGILGVLLALVLIVLVLYMRRNQGKLTEKNLLIEKEKARSDELLLNILPVDLAIELKENGSAKAQSFDNATVFFSDFKDFTKIGERLTPTELVEELDHCFKAFDKIIEKYDIEKIKTVGDAYICASGLSHQKNKSPKDVVKAAIEIRDFVLDRIKNRKKEKKEFFEIRIGVHTGPIVAGIVGFKKFAYDIWGDTVNTAARMEQHSEPGKVNVSSETFELIKTDFSFTYRGAIEAKGKGAVDMYFINDLVSNKEKSS